MGEYAEMILDGILCERCGDFLSGEPIGFPQTCGECHKKMQRKQKKSAVAAANFKKGSFKK